MNPERHPLSDKQIYGADVDDDDMDAILREMDKFDEPEKPDDTR